MPYSGKHRNLTDGDALTEVKCLKEIPENGADMSHLNIVHDRALMCGGNPDHSWFQWEFVKHVWNGSWRPSNAEGEEHIAIMELRHEMCLIGKIPLIVLNVVTKQVQNERF